MDYLLYLLVRGLCGALSLLPHNWSLKILAGLIRIIFYFLPKYRRIAETNLLLAFPDKNLEFRDAVFKDMSTAIARLILDFNRMQTLDEKWCAENINYVDKDLLDSLTKNKDERGIIIATGHLGSFEIMAQSLRFSGFDMSFIVRNFKNKYIDAWWNSKRELNGNTVVSRRGAYKKGLKALNAGKTFGILFDQNVTSNHAVFVNFFNRRAATTKIVAALAMRTNARVVVTNIKFENGKYQLYQSEPDFKELYRSEEISFEEKERLITQEITDRYQSMISNYPGEWFWMHRRWKTTPDGKNENFYD